MKWACLLLALRLVAASSQQVAHQPAASSTVKSNKVSHAAGATAARTPAASSKHVSKTAASGRTGRGRAHGKSARASGPSYQLHPEPERYQQIQQALAERGYFKGEANGQWGDDSGDALRHFQDDKKLDSGGKIDALTLRGLGLGPRHDGGMTVSSGKSEPGGTAGKPSAPLAPEAPGAAVPKTEQPQGGPDPPELPPQPSEVPPSIH